MNELKSIAVICNDYPSEGRASYVFVEQLVNALVDMGIDVKVIALQSLMRIALHRESRLPGRSAVSTKRGNVYEVFRPVGISFGNRSGFLGSCAIKYNSRKISALLRSMDVDALYCHFWENVQKVKGFALQNDLPVFVACGEGDNAIENLMDTISQRDKQELVNCIKGVISVSSENRRKCLEYSLATKEKIIVLPNCTDTSIFNPQDASAMRHDLGIGEQDFTIVFVGGFIPRKGPDRVARAMANLSDKHIKAIFIGKPFSGYDYDFDCPGIVFKGPVNHDELPQLLNCADVFVLPTLKEGCCNAIIEALACGLPIISSDGPFNDDILDEKNSIRVNPDDVSAITEAIAYLRDNPDVRERMRSVSLERHNQYSIEGRARRIVSFIKDSL